MPTHVVKEGECLSTIAHRHGFFWETIWKLPENDGLRELRANPNVLQKGDAVFIPELRAKTLTKATEQRHVVELKDVPFKYKICLRQGGVARSNMAYTIEFDDGTIEDDTTDDKGLVEGFVPTHAQRAKLSLQGEKCTDVYRIEFGKLDPFQSADDVRGLQQRLHNLGYRCADNGKYDEQTQRKLRKFQDDNELRPTGELDDRSKNKIIELHGS